MDTWDDYYGDEPYDGPPWIAILNARLVALALFRAAVVVLARPRTLVEAGALVAVVTA